MAYRLGDTKPFLVVFFTDFLCYISPVLTIIPPPPPPQRLFDTKYSELLYMVSIISL